MSPDDSGVSFAAVLQSKIHMLSNHDHPGEQEPRSYGQTHHENKNIDLNTATVDELADLPMVGRERAEAIANARPFQSWDDVERIPGLSAGMIDDLKSGLMPSTSGEPSGQPRSRQPDKRP